MDQAATVEAVSGKASEPYVGRWLQLVSSTNWEKGRIIQEWRTALQRAGASPTEYSDEAWARRVNGVTGQHVGRLRRVFDRFGHVYEQYEGIFWSHFQAALDWDDAEMWLEGAVRSRWSVAEMRRTRWETLGEVARAGESPNDDSVTSELDEDFVSTGEGPPEGALVPQLDEVQAIDDEEPPAARADRTREGEAKPQRAPKSADEAEPHSAPPFSAPSAPPVRPFADLPPLPDDLADAYEGLKLAILRHKSAGWSDFACGDLLAYLDALKELALAPSGDDAPF